MIRSLVIAIIVIFILYLFSAWFLTEVLPDIIPADW